MPSKEQTGRSPGVAWISCIQTGREKAIVNHPGTAESEKFWNDTVQQMRRFYSTAGLIQFKVGS